eukprot:scaffold1.g5212.t1
MPPRSARPDVTCCAAAARRSDRRQGIYARLRPGALAASGGAAESFLCSVEAQLYTSAGSKGEYADARSLEARLLRFLSSPPPTVSPPPAAGPSPQSRSPTSGQAAMATLGAAAGASSFLLAQPVAAAPPAGPVVSAEQEGTRHPPLPPGWQPHAPAQDVSQPAPKRSRQSTPPLPPEQQQALAQQAFQLQHLELAAPAAAPALVQPPSQPLFATSDLGLAQYQQPVQHQPVQPPHQLHWPTQPLSRAGSAPPATSPAGGLPAGAGATSALASAQQAQAAAQQATLHLQQQQQQQQLYAASLQQQAVARAAPAPAPAPQPQLVRPPSAPPAVGALPSIQAAAVAAQSMQQQQGVVFHQILPPATQPLQQVPPQPQQQLITYAYTALPPQQPMAQQPQQQVLLPAAAAPGAALQAAAAAQQQLLRHSAPAALLPAVNSQQLLQQQLLQHMQAQQQQAAHAAHAQHAAQAALLAQRQLHVGQPLGLAGGAAAAAAAEDDNESTGSHTSPTSGPQATAAELVSAASELCTCPLTRVMLEDPVVAADGHTYERAAIEAWMRGHGHSPVTGKPLPSFDLKPNLTVKALTRLLRQQQQRQGARPQQQRQHQHQQ